MEVLRINYRDALGIRKMMLNPNLTKKQLIFENDDDEHTFHLGAFIEGRLVSIASFFLENHPDLKYPNQFRLRGMATLSEYQGQGLSSALLRRAFPIVQQNSCQALWCFARQKAVGFYLKNGFIEKDKAFLLEDIGIHQLMVKEVGATENFGNL